MNFIDLFAGVGGFRTGMEMAGHKCVGYCEFDKYASASYRMMYTCTDEQRAYISSLPKNKRVKELQKDKYLNGEWYQNDIRAVGIGRMPKCDCWCFGAPCQDFSVAGKRAGLEGDRSSLIREVFRALEEWKEKDRPEWIIYENVKGMLSSNGGLDYLSIIIEMDRLGYDVEWQIINSKWFVPQNRERVYTIGHLRRYGRRKVLPIQKPGGENRIRQVGKLAESTRADPSRYRVFDSNVIAPCLVTCQGGGLQPHILEYMTGIDKSVKGQDRQVANCILAREDSGVANRKAEGTAIVVKVKEATKKGYAEATIGDSINLSAIDSKTRRGRVGKGISNTLDTGCNQAVVLPCLTSNIDTIYSDKYGCNIAIRKLTPKECWRLQGFPDELFELAQIVNSNSQLYKQAGNSVTVDVVFEIAKKLANRNETND